MQHELEVAIDAATAAAQAIRAIYDRADAWVEDKSGGRGPLTAADLAADQILQERLRAAFPDDAVLSEERADDAVRLGHRRVWILDPLDGTQEFVERIPQFVVSVALVVDGRAAVGVLVHPLSGQVMSGIVGVGAWLDGAPARPTARATLDGARILVSRTELNKGMFAAWEGRADLEPVGSVAYKLGLVGVGLADATFTPRPRWEWDVAAGAAIVEAAGGRATDRTGAPYAFNRPKPLVDGVVVSNGPLHGALLELAAE